MEPSKLNPLNWDQGDWLKSGLGVAAGAAVARAFNGDWKAVAACGTAGLILSHFTGLSSDRALQSYTVQNNKPRLKLDLSRLNLFDITIPQIEAALKEKLGIQPSEGSEEIKGSQGTVNKWNDKDGNCLAVKIIQPKQINISWTGLDKGEINSILIPEHPNIIKAKKLLMVNTDNEYLIIQSKQDIPEQPNKKLYIIAMISDWIDGKDLFEQLAQRQHKDLIALAVNVSLDMCKALEHLHTNGFVYRDLKPENIMFDGQYRLADLGMSKYLGEGSTQTPCGSLEYFSFDTYSTHDKRIDLWTLGVLILDIAMRWTPVDYPKRVEDKKTKENQVGKFIQLTEEQREKYLRDQFSKAFSTCPELLNLVCRLLKKPESRPYLKDIESTLSQIRAQLVGRNLAKKIGEDITNR